MRSGKHGGATHIIEVRYRPSCTEAFGVVRVVIEALPLVSWNVTFALAICTLQLMAMAAACVIIDDPGHILQVTGDLFRREFADHAVVI